MEEEISINCVCNCVCWELDPLLQYTFAETAILSKLRNRLKGLIPLFLISPLTPALSNAISQPFHQFPVRHSLNTPLATADSAHPAQSAVHPHRQADSISALHEKQSSFTADWRCNVACRAASRALYLHIRVTLQNAGFVAAL